MNRPSSLGLLVAGLLLVLAPASSAAPRRHLFLEPSFLVETEGMALRVNPAADGEQVLQADQPWEDQWLPFYSTVLDEGGKLRMWYNCRDQAGWSNVAYAESVDGLHWTKPNLGLIDYKGSTANNLVGLHTLEGAVHRDPHGAPDARYIYVASLHKGGGVFRFHSPDGLHWQQDPAPLLAFECDTQNVAFWDDLKQKYALYLRSWGPKSPRNDRRKLVRLEADSLEAPLPVKPAGAPYHENGDRERQPWIDREAVTVLAADAQDPAETDIYTSAMQPYPVDPHWYVGFPSFFRHYVDSPQKVSDGWTETQFVGSGDGVHWQRYDRAVYAGPGQAGPLSGRMVFMGLGLVVRGDEIWQYGTRFRTSHGDTPGRKAHNDGALYRFRQRLDGFVSADFGNVPGRCRTAAVTVDGPRLWVNLDGGAVGELRVGLLDESGRPLPGYGPEDCTVLRLNSTHAPVTWKGGDLSALQGRAVQVVFAGFRTKLYSFYFSVNP